MGLFEKKGSRLGGNTGPYALRALGKDSFLLSYDVEKCLKAFNVYDGSSSSKRSRLQIQNFFNELQQESALSFQQLSQILAYSIGDNVVHAQQSNEKPKKIIKKVAKK